MLNLSLSEVSRGEVRIRDEIPPDHPMWEGTEVRLSGPLQVDMGAREVGQGVFLRGTLRGTLRVPCRRCVAETDAVLDEEVDFLFDELGEDADEVAGEVYPLPARGDGLDLTEAVREEVLLRVPRYVLCREECRGLCPRCGADLNTAPCDCVPEEGGTPWDALKKIRFDRP